MRRPTPGNPKRRGAQSTRGKAAGARRPRVAGRTAPEQEPRTGDVPAVPSPTPRPVPAPAGDEREPGGESESPDLGEATGEATAETSGAGGEGERPRRVDFWRRLLRACLVVIIVLGFGFGAGAGVEAYLLRATGPAGNAALVDAGRTQRLTSQVSDAISQAFSYNYADTKSTRQRARSVLTSDAMRQYDALFGKVSTQASESKLILQTTVRAIGVKRVDGDTAHLLVVVDQQKLQGTGGKHSSSTSGMDVSATRSQGDWKVAHIHFR